MADETLGEAFRRQDRHEQQHRDDIAAVRRECEQRAATHLDRDLYLAERTHMVTRLADIESDAAKTEQRLSDRVRSLEGRLTWAWRAAVTGVVLPVLVLIIGWIIVQGRQ